MKVQTFLLSKGTAYTSHTRVSMFSSLSIFWFYCLWWVSFIRISS